MARRVVFTGGTMIVKYITYGKLITKPGYQNERAEITIEVNEGDSTDVVFAKAKLWVERKLGIDDDIPF